MASTMDQIGMGSASCEDLSHQLDHPITDRIVNACMTTLNPSGNDEDCSAMRFRKPLFARSSANHRKFPLSEHLDA